MAKKIFSRGLIGAPLGLAVSTAMAIVISLAVGDGRFYMVARPLIEDYGSEVAAVLVQAVCSLVVGAAWGCASYIWEKEGWSLIRQMVVHWLIGACVTLPIAYLLHWMERSIAGFFSYLGIFCGIYLAIWLSQYFSIKKNIQQINEKLQDERCQK